MLSRKLGFAILALSAALAAQTPPPGPRLMSNEELTALPQTPQAKGDQLRHYFFKEAGREVPYRIYVPSRYDGKSKLPFMVCLHGAGGTQDSLMDWGHGMLKDLAEKHGYIVATPLGYPLGGSYGQHYNIGIPDSARAGKEMSAAERKQSDEWSEKDVLNVTEIVAKEYGVDRSRIYLMGHSRGALATWYLGDKYRSLWAGLAPVAGGFLDTDYPFEHLRGLPVIVSQGSADAVALPERARQQVAAMEKLNLHPKYVEVPGATHGSIVDAALPGIFDFFDEHAPQAKPHL
jgi:predicted peptidase